MKVRDPLTGKVSWRKGLRGMVMGFDGKPTSKYTPEHKKQPTHRVHIGHIGHHKTRPDK